MGNTVGIYAIRNLATGQTYIGQSTNVAHRFRQHRNALWQQRHPNAHLLSAWWRYGELSFEFCILQVCEPPDLGRLEEYWLSTVPENLRYNLGPAGDNPTRGVPKTSAHKLKLSRSRGGGRLIGYLLDTETGKETVIYDFVHSGEAEAAGFRQSSIWKATHGVMPTYKGLRWKIVKGQDND